MSPAGSGTPATANTETKRNRVLQAIRFQAEAGFKKPMRDNDFGMEETREWLFRIWNLRGPPRNTHSCHVSHMSVEPPTSQHAAFQFAKEPYNLPTLPITETKCKHVLIYNTYSRHVSHMSVKPPTSERAAF
ncbi:hypothetical protein HDK77DRAFT_431993 [Phyllosticta capitalensis]